MYGGAPQQERGGGGDDAALMAALMAAAAQEEAKKKQAAYLEAALPVALLIILALIFAVKLGFIDLGFLPFFNRPISVLILTDNSADASIQNTIQVLQKSASYYKIQVRVMSISPSRRIYAAQLADSDVVMLYQTGEKPALSLIQRRELAKFLRAGGKMIVVLNSGTYVPQCDIVGVECDPNAVQWVGWLELKQFMPVECYAEEACQPESVHDAVIYTIDPEHPIMRGFEVVPSEGSLTLETLKDIQLSKNGIDIADIYVGGLDNPVAVYPGITISTGLTGAKVVHFNYDPWKTPSILVNTILYLAGRSG